MRKQHGILEVHHSKYGAPRNAAGGVLNWVSARAAPPEV